MLSPIFRAFNNYLTLSEDRRTDRRREAVWAAHAPRASLGRFPAQPKVGKRGGCFFENSAESGYRRSQSQKANACPIGASGVAQPAQGLSAGSRRAKSSQITASGGTFRTQISQKTSVLSKPAVSQARRKKAHSYTKAGLPFPDNS